MQSRSINRVVAVAIIAVVVLGATASIGWTLGVLRPADDELLPLVLRVAIVFFTVEATRMFVHVMIGASFYRPAEQLQGSGFAPLTSVVIPAWNEEVGLGKTIDSVLASDYANLEIIIVNDGSTDRTAEVAQRYVDENPGRVFLVNQENAGKGAALNSGVMHGFGQIIVNVDADSAVEPEAIGNLVKPFASKRVDAVVGRIVIGNTKKFVGKSQAFEYMFGFHLRRAQSVFNTIFILSGAMCAYRRSAWQQTHGFRDFSKTEDMDFSLQLRDAGLGLVYADDAVCITEGAADLSGLRNQRRRWRFGAFFCFGAHRRLFLDRRRGNRSLGFYELPSSLLGYVQILLYPLVFAVAFILPIHTGQYLYFYLVLLSVPANFAVVFYASGTLRKYAKYLPVLIVLMCVTMAVEHLMMWSALARYLTGNDVSWTNWTRQGVDGESGVDRVAVPGVPAMTLAEQMDARMVRGLREILDRTEPPVFVEPPTVTAADAEQDPTGEHERVLEPA
ncbi:glycosyltransferase [Ilumatobacter coccineus]|uniref:Putative glycosyltransferase n=1 Tax=Ilumatobacter coccineus (strain NBRC 103263 / KCTC 29153 / YM16-304) TaxID=1313172 RepID=A0A6C7EH33_ILUCY|nr:glycosyltransferase family 2 protein [Ilumatobacter coccineus]BAN03888.1 putative glycosyltransferase [Ilumatobacter coccineus YM16-304]